MTDGGYTQTEAWNLQLQARVDRLEAAMKEVEMEAISDFEKELLQSAKELNTVLRRNVPAPTYMYGDLGEVDQIATLEEDLSLRTKELNKVLRRNVKLRAAIYRMLGADEVGDGEAFEQALNHLKEVVKSND